MEMLSNASFSTGSPRGDFASFVKAFLERSWRTLRRPPCPLCIDYAKLRAELAAESTRAGRDEAAVDSFFARRQASRDGRAYEEMQLRRRLP
jgi:hypothetical protein